MFLLRKVTFHLISFPFFQTICSPQKGIIVFSQFTPARCFKVCVIDACPFGSCRSSIRCDNTAYFGLTNPSAVPIISFSLGAPQRKISISTSPCTLANRSDSKPESPQCNSEKPPPSAPQSIRKDITKSGSLGLLK